MKTKTRQPTKKGIARGTKARQSALRWIESEYNVGALPEEQKEKLISAYVAGWSNSLIDCITE